MCLAAVCCVLRIRVCASASVQSPDPSHGPGSFSVLRPREPCHPWATRSRVDSAWMAGLALGTAPRPLTLLKLLGGAEVPPAGAPGGQLFKSVQS